MDKTIFTSEECVVCLDGKPVPYFMPCGHQCCCQSCSSEILAVNMPCPLCRQLIAQERHIILEEHDELQPVPNEELRAFAQERRKDYLAELKGHVHAKNAAFVGKGKFARQVGAAIGNELERRRQETAGGERCMTPRSKITMRVADNLLHVDWKVGRKLHRDAYAYCDWPVLESELQALYADGRMPSALTLATDEPAYYWLVHHYTEGKVDEALDKMRGERRKRAKK